MTEPNVIKQVCADFNLSYKDLAEEIGYGEDTIKKSASSGKMSKPFKKAIKLYIENQKLKEQIELPNQLRLIISKIMNYQSIK